MLEYTNNSIEQERAKGANNYDPFNVNIVTGYGVWLEDDRGNRYIDMLSAYSALNQGHLNQTIIGIAIDQMRKLYMLPRAFCNEERARYFDLITKLTSKDRVLPMNTGAEIVETAIKTARKWGYYIKGIEKNKAKIIVCEGNFHGRTLGSVSASTETQYRDGFGPFLPGFKKIPYGNADALEKAITPCTAGFLVEPIQGEGGVRVPPNGYLNQCFEICRRNNVLLILDEVQTGFGRTGKMFAYEHENITPDILLLGKALSGGLYPISAMLADDEIMQVFQPGDHGSTFGGSPLASAIASAAITETIYKNLPENARIMGDYFMQALKNINSPYVEEIRGKGLLIGVEIKRKAGPARPFCEKLIENGVLTKDTHHTVIRFAPPLIITKEQIDWAMERVEKVLG